MIITLIVRVNTNFWDVKANKLNDLGFTDIALW